MASETTRADGRIDWPPEWERTPSQRREHTSKFEVTLSQTFDDLEAELNRIGVDDYRYSFDARQRKRDGRPYARANPDDPSFVLRWTMDGEQYAVACDHYTGFRDNVRALYLYVREKRKMEARPVKTGQSEFATARLPPGDEEHAIAAEPAEPQLSDEEAADLLGVTPDVPARVVETAYQDAIKSEHPDQGGQGDIGQLQQARDQLLNSP